MYKDGVNLSRQVVEDLFILEYMLNEGIENVLYPGDLEQDIYEKLRAITRRGRSGQNMSLTNPPVSEFSPIVHPMKNSVRKLKPLAYFSRASVLSCCMSFAKSEDIIQNTLLSCSESSESDAASMDYVKKFIRTGAELYGEFFDVQRVVDQLDNICGLYALVEQNAGKIVDRVALLDRKLSVLRIPLKISLDINILRAARRKRGALPESGKPTISFSQAKTPKLADFKIIFLRTLRKLLSYLTIENVNQPDLHRLHEFIESNMVNLEEDVDYTLSQILMRKSLDLKKTTGAHFLIHRRSFQPMKKLPPLSKPCPINEVIIWDMTYYISVICNKVSGSRASDTTLDHLEAAYNSQFFDNKKTTPVYINLAATLLPSLQRDLIDAPFKLESVKFVARLVTDHDFIWLCDQLTILIKTLPSNNRHYTLSKRISDTYEALKQYHSLCKAGIRPQVPIIELHWTDNAEKSPIIVAAPSLGFHFITPEIKIIQAHCSIISSFSYCA